MAQTQRAIAASALILGSALTASAPLPAQAPGVGSFHLVSSVRVTRTVSEFTYRATLVNGGALIAGAIATATSVSPATTIVDGSLAFGPAEPGGSVPSTDTFSFRHDRTRPFSWASITWTVATVPVDADADFDLELDPTPTSISAGSSALILFRLQRDPGFVAPITVALIDPPSGVSGKTLELPPGMTAGALPVTVSKAVVAGSIPIELAGTGLGLTRTARGALTVRAEEPRAQAKIQAAVDAGAIDLPTSLLYRAYAIFGDPRLPEAYRGSGSVREDRSLFDEIEDVLKTAADDVRAQLEPFTLRPSNSNSWYNQLLASLPPATADIVSTSASRSALSPIAASTPTPDSFLPASCDALEPAGLPTGSWISRRHSIYPFRVWARCTSAAVTPAFGDPAEIDIDRASQLVGKVWGYLTATMGPPLPDRRTNDPVLRDSGLGDESIDIYLVFDGETVPRFGSAASLEGDSAGAEFSWISPVSTVGSKESGFILFRQTDVRQNGFHMSVIHEVFHLLQDAHNSDLGPAWWYTEASATWAEAHWDRVIGRLEPWAGGRAAFDEVYTKFVDRFQKRGSTRPLNSADGDADEDPAYEAFIWPYFMSQVSGGTEALPAGAAWRAVEGVATPAAADAAMAGVFSFDDHFREFAVRNLNQAFDPGDPLPRTDRWVGLDDELAGFKPADGVPPVTQEEILLLGTDKDVEVEVAPLAAHYSTWRVGDIGIKRVIFRFEQLTANGLAADAMVKIFDRAWTREDYAGVPEVTFCLDDPDQTLETLQLVVSNPHLKAPGTKPTKAKFHVTASAVPCEERWVGTSRYEIRRGAYWFVVSATVTWQPGVRIPGSPERVVMETESGLVTIERFEVEGGACIVTPASWPIFFGGSTSGEIVQQASLLITYPSGGAPFATGSGYANWPTMGSCGGSATGRFPIFAIWFESGGTVPLTADGQEIAGSFFQEKDGETRSSTFEFRLVRK